MGSYISEAIAKNTLEEIIETFTDDFVIYVRKRTTKATALKVVTFAIVLMYFEENEKIYNAIMNYNIENNEDTKILQSETFLDNAKKKEVFYVECLIGID